MDSAVGMKNNFIIAHAFGGLARLARAFDWQSKGQRFDSDILHLIIKKLQILKFVVPFFIHTIVHTIWYYLQTVLEKISTYELFPFY